MNIGDEESQPGNRHTTEQIDDLDLAKLATSSRCCLVLARADALDRKWSERVHSMDNFAVELVLFPFAHFFNRFYNILGFITTFLAGSYRYDYMLTTNGYQPLGAVESSTQFRMGLCFLVYYILTSGVMIGFVWVMKLVTKRIRPQRNPKTSRLNNLRASENGTYSMPSGDSAQAALFCFLYATLLGLPEVYIILPFVCLGRVYYQCHWLGDTVVGVFVGTLWSLVFLLMFRSFT